MKIRKILAMMVGMSMLVSLFSGCGTSSKGVHNSADLGTGSGKKIVKFWAHQDEAWGIAYEDMIAKFEDEHPEYEVQTEYYPYDDFQIKIQTSLMTKGKGADVYAMWGGWALDFVGSGVLAEAPEDLTKDMKHDFYEPAVAAYKYKDKYYGVPMEYNLEFGGMLVNKKLFGESEYTYPTTWEDLEQISDKVSKINGNVMEMRGFDFISWDSLPYLWLGMILSSGGQYLNEDGTVDFTSEIAVSTMEQLKSYVVDRHWTNLDSLTQNTDAYRKLYEGKSFMNPIGCWSVSQGELAYGLKYDEDYEYVKVPGYGEKTGFAAETGWGMVVPESSKDNEGAWKLIEFFTDAENLIDFNIACTQLPPRKSMMNNEKYLSAMPYTGFLLDILEDGQWIGPYNTESFKGAINDMFVALCLSEEYDSVKDALAQLTETINQTKIN